jgi:effector-binding domain-containing protein
MRRVGARHERRGLYGRAVDYTVVLERVEPRHLAAAAGAVASHAELGQAIIKLLDQVWPVLRAQGAATRHNVVLYSGGAPLRIEAGVEVPDGFQPTHVVRRVSTPSGQAASATHWGDYSAMAPAYAAIDAWCQANGRRRTHLSWEVYGDWSENPAEVRTDIFVLLES